jgi:hypothetical protein
MIPVLKGTTVTVFLIGDKASLAEITKELL